MDAQPLDYVQARPRARAMPVERDTLDAIQDWLRDEATDGTQANLIGGWPVDAPTDPLGGTAAVPPALYLSHPDAPGTHRCAFGEWVIITGAGRVQVYPSEDAFRLDWERPERPGRGQ